MNIAICAVILRSFCEPFLNELESYYDSPQEKLEAVRIVALDMNNTEVIEICDWIESAGLIETFFPEGVFCE